MGFPGSSVVKNLPANAGDRSSIPGTGRSPEGNDNPLQYSCLENPMDRGDCQATVHGLAKELDMTEWLNSNNKDSSLQKITIKWSRTWRMWNYRLCILVYLSLRHWKKHWILALSTCWHLTEEKAATTFFSEHNPITKDRDVDSAFMVSKYMKRNMQDIC